MRDFHHQWLVMDNYANKLTKDSKYPTVTPDLAPVLAQETERFIAEVTFTQGKGFPSLMTAPFTFVNSTTAPLYGVSGSFGSSLTRVDLDADEARGPVHAARLPGDARVHQPELADPPRRVHPAQRPVRDDPRSAAQHARAAAADGDADDAPAGRHAHRARRVRGLPPPATSTRSASDSRTTTPPASSGRRRTASTIDATGTLAGTAANTAFTDGVSASAAIAASPEAQRCYSATWMRYAFGRAEAAADDCAIQVLGSRLADDNYKITDLMVDITRTTAFMFRGAN